MDYQYKSAPYKHQEECFLRSRDEEIFAILFEMGCVDADTEFLSPTGWKKISDYSGGRVAQFNLDGTAEFVIPEKYVKLPCDTLFHFKNARGVDQMLSSEHRILFAHNSSSRNKTGQSTWKTQVSDKVLLEEYPSERWHEATVCSYLNRRPSHVRTPCTFHIKTDTRIDLSDDLIRIMVMFQADGSYGTRDLSTITDKRRAGIHVKKERKKERARALLAASGLDWEERESYDGFTDFLFVPPVVSKTYGEWWWKASYEQLEVICDEVCHWDGSIEDGNRGSSFFSSVKEDIDFIQYAFSATGKRCSSGYGDPEGVRDRSREGCVHVVGSGRTGVWCSFPEKAEEFKPKDGFKYCFSVPSGYLVFRRNGNVFCTGNSGKSKVAVDTAAYLYGQGRINCLVILAPNGVHKKWLREDIPFSLPDYIDTRTAVWDSSDRYSEAECEKLLNPGECLRILCANVEGLSYEKLPKFLRRLLIATDAMVVVDESTRIKSPTAARTKALYKLKNMMKYRRILAGDAVVNSPFDLFSQFGFLDEEILGYSFPVFKAEYAELLKPGDPLLTAIMRKTNARFAPQIIAKNPDGTAKYKNLDKLKTLIAPHSMRVNKADCIDLPPKIYEKRYFKLSKEQRKMYDQMVEDLRYELNDETVPIMHKLTLLLRLQQLCSGYVKDINGDTVDLFAANPKENPRISALLDTLEDIEGQVIIWCRFTEDIRTICKVLGEEAVPYFGQIDNKQREENLAVFRSGGKRFMVGNPQVGGIGLNLTNSATAIYYSNSFNAGERYQSEDRCHRIGQTSDKVLYIDLEAEDTVDNKIITALKVKKNLGDFMMELNSVKQAIV